MKRALIKKQYRIYLKFYIYLPVGSLLCSIQTNQKDDALQ